MTAPNIRKALADYRSIADRIRAEFPGEDEADLRDTIAGETYLDEAIASALREADIRKRRAKGALGEVIERLKRRQEREIAQAERLEAFALWATQEVGWERIDAPDFIAWINPGQAKVHEGDLDKLPPEFVRMKIERSAKKKEIREALERGEEVGEAKLGNRVPYWIRR